MNPDKIIEEWKDKSDSIHIKDGTVTIQGSSIIQFAFHQNDIIFYRIVVYPSSQGIYFYYYHHGDPNSCFDDNRWQQGLNTLSFEKFSEVVKERHLSFFEWIIWNLL